MTSHCRTPFSIFGRLWTLFCYSLVPWLAFPSLLRNDVLAFQSSYAHILLGYRAQPLEYGTFSAHTIQNDRTHSSSSALRAVDRQASSTDNGSPPISPSVSNSRFSASQRAKPFPRPSPKRPHNANSRPPKGNTFHGGRSRFTTFSKELNTEIVQASSSTAVLDILQRKTKLGLPKAGGTMSIVNYSTAIHRLARFCVRGGNYYADRATVLSDPRTALLVASFVEAILDDEKTIKVGGREMANISWALAKLKLPPPLAAMPASGKHVKTTAAQVRQLIIRMAKEKSRDPVWVPELSKLAGQILDHFADSVEDGSIPLKVCQPQNMSNFLWAMSTAKRPNSVVYGLLVRGLIQRAKEGQADGTFVSSPQEWSNTMWSFATTQIYNGSDELMAFLASLFEADPSHGDAFNNQEVANTLWGVATLLSNKSEEPITELERKSALTIIRCLASSMARRRANDFRSQELSNSIWAMATVGFGIATTERTTPLNHNKYVVLETERPAEDLALMEKTVNVVVQKSAPLLGRFKPQELNNLVWALARLLRNNKEIADQVSMEDLMWKVCECLSRMEGKVRGRDIGTTLWGFSQLGMKDPDLYRSLASQVPPSAAYSYRPQEFSNSLYALASSGIKIDDQGYFDRATTTPKRQMKMDPLVGLFEIAGIALIQRSSEFKTQELKDVLWSFSTAGIRHPKLFKAAAVKVVENYFTSGRKLLGFQSQSLGNLAWAYGKQAQMGGEFENMSKGQAAGRLGQYISTALDLGEDLAHNLFNAICETMLSDYDNLRGCYPQDIANTAWALSVMGFKKETYLSVLQDALKDKLSRYVQGQRSSLNAFNGQEIANTLWAMATLNVHPGDTLQVVWEYLQDRVGGPGEYSLETIAGFFNRQELGNIVWACTVFDEFPEPLMTFLYTGLIGNGSEQDIARAARAYKDDGLQGSTITTMIYMQASMDRLKGISGPSLPENFPGQWGEPDSVKATKMQEDDASQTYAINAINTSNIQSAIARAFRRIRFNHVEEFTLSTVDIARHYGMREPAEPIEILSIDIANVEERLAIEVDGPAHFINIIDEHESDSLDGAPSRPVSDPNNDQQHRFTWTGNRQEMSGPTILKHRLLEEFGWTVIHLPFWEWNTVIGDAEKEDDFCRQLVILGKSQD